MRLRREVMVDFLGTAFSLTDRLAVSSDGGVI